MFGAASEGTLCRLTFGVWRLMFDVWRLTFEVSRRRQHVYLTSIVDTYIRHLPPVNAQQKEHGTSNLWILNSSKYTDDIANFHQHVNVKEGTSYK